MSQVIKRVTSNVFIVQYPPINRVTISFERLVAKFKEQHGNRFAVFEHWQPFSQLWAYYDIKNDSYISCDFSDVIIDKKISGNLITNIQVPKMHANDRPTACKVYLDCTVALFDNGTLNVVLVK